MSFWAGRCCSPPGTPRPPATGSAAREGPSRCWHPHPQSPGPFLHHQRNGSSPSSLQPINQETLRTNGVRAPPVFLPCPPLPHCSPFLLKKDGPWKCFYELNTIKQKQHRRGFVSLFPSSRVVLELLPGLSKEYHSIPVQLKNRFINCFSVFSRWCYCSYADCGQWNANRCSWTVLQFQRCS